MPGHLVFYLRLQQKNVRRKFLIFLCNNNKWKQLLPVVWKPSWYLKRFVCPETDIFFWDRCFNPLFCTSKPLGFKQKANMEGFSKVAPLSRLPLEERLFLVTATSHSFSCCWYRSHIGGWKAHENFRQTITKHTYTDHSQKKARYTTYSRHACTQSNT